MKISALALLKMVMHARSGGRLEVMGLILGKIDGPTMVVMDVFAVPVEGTETRVNAQTEAYEYMSTYIDSSKRVRFDKSRFCNNYSFSRLDGWKMRWVGITVTLDMGVGCLVLMLGRK